VFFILAVSVVVVVGVWKGIVFDLLEVNVFCAFIANVWGDFSTSPLVSSCVVNFELVLAFFILAFVFYFHVLVSVVAPMR